MAQSRTFALALADQLRRRDWSQRHFATLAGEHQTLVVRILNGQRRPPLDRLGRWLELLEPGPAEADELVRLALATHGAAALADRLLPPPRSR